MTIQRFETNARMSQVVIHGDTVYLAGQVANDPKADVATQTRQVLEKVDRLLALAGTDKTKLLSATVWLTDMRYFPAMNEVWDAWVPAGHGPARACIGTPLALTDLKVEIGIIAARS